MSKLHTVEEFHTDSGATIIVDQRFVETEEHHQLMLNLLIDISMPGYVTVSHMIMPPYEGVESSYAVKLKEQDETNS